VLISEHDRRAENREEPHDLIGANGARILFDLGDARLPKAQPVS
jgi:hypothetical protein